MPLYADLYAQSDRESESDEIQWSYVAHLYEQPLLNRWKGQAYEWADFLWKSGPWKRVDRFFESRHDRKCGDGCVTGYRRNEDGSSTPVQMCGYTPLSVRLELSQYFASDKNRRIIARVPVPQSVWDRDKLDGRA